MVEIIGGKIIQRASFGNEAFAIPLTGVDTSTGGFGGSHAPVFVFTDFPVVSAFLSF